MAKEAKETKGRLVGFRIPHSLYNRLAAHAEKRNVYVSVVLREALEKHAAKLPKNPRRELV